MGIRQDIENTYKEAFNSFPNNEEWDFEDELLDKLSPKDIREINKQTIGYNSKCSKVTTRKATPEELARAERAIQHSKNKKMRRKNSEVWNDYEEE